MTRKSARSSSRERFAARARAARLRSLRPVAIVLAVVGMGAASAWLLLGSGLFTVHSVTVRGTDRLAASDILAAVGPIKGDALLTLDTGSLARRVEAISGVRVAHVSRKWPSSVRITLVERTPVATVHRSDGWWLVDGQGVEFGPPGPRLSALRVLRLPASGERAAAARSATQVLRALPAALLSTVTLVEASSEDSVQLVLASGARVVWGSPDRSADKARILATLVRHKAHVYDVSSPSVVTTR